MANCLLSNEDSKKQDKEKKEQDKERKRQERIERGASRLNGGDHIPESWSQLENTARW